MELIIDNTRPALPDGFRVFTAILIGRLAVMNAAVRALREMGYQVIAQALFPVRGDMPEVVIQRSPQKSIGPLLDCSGKRYWRNEAGHKFGVAEFQGVTVTWEES